MNAIIDFALRQRVLIIVLLVAVLGGGAVSFLALNIEAYPDPVPPLVDVVTQSTGQSAEEIERYITIPLEVQMAGIPNVQAIRTISLFGLSDVKIQFTYAFNYEQAEQWVINRLAQAPPLPNGAQPQISPTSPIGEIFRYRLVGPGNYSATDLKTLQDWVLERRFKAVPGVVDVTGWGGKTKTYEIAVDERKLMAYGVPLPSLINALNNANINVGGQTVNFGEQSAVVRGVGLVHSADDIRRTLISGNQGSPVLISDVADVKIGNLPRLGIAGFNESDDIVQGIVLMRRGAQSVPTIKRVEAEVDRINASGILPPGVSIERIYDRSDLINVTTRTVLHNMLAGVALIFLLQWLFLGNLRSALIVIMTIPFAFAFAIGLMLLRGESANLLSVGAIDFGLVVDATVIMVENIFRHLVEAGSRDNAGMGSSLRARSSSGFRVKMNTVSTAAAEVGRSIFFAAAIIIAGFVPLFTLSGIEGHIFGPMAKTYAYAITGGLLATFTVAPALSLLLFPQKPAERETPLVRILRRLYLPSLEFALANRIVTFSAIALAAVLAVGAVRALGLEFLPALEEGNLWVRATFPQAVSLEESNSYVNRMRKLMNRFPEVQNVVSQHGRPDDGTDATGFFNAEFFVPLKPASRWPGGISKAELTRQMTDALTQEFPGVDFNFSQYIQDNVEEAASGVKGENSVKVYGNDLETLEKKAGEISAVLAKVPGITDLAVLRSLGQPTIRIDVDRQQAGRYGLSTGDVNAVVQSAIGGQSAGDLYEPGSDRHFPMMVRLALPYRQNLEAIRHIPIVAANSGNGVTQISLEDVASVRLVSGAAFIYREQQQRYVPIKFSVRGRDLGGAVLEAQRAVEAQVTLPGGYRVEWVGEFGNLREAAARLSIAVPLSIALIVLLLYLKFGSFRDALLAASVIPMAVLGGIFALWLTGTPFSVSSAIGFVALFGIAAMDGILVLSYFHHLLDLGQERTSAILETCRTQLRPVVMTCIVACVGLVPAAFSTGIGSQVQRPLALVVVGGMLLAPVLILLVLPALILKFSRTEEQSSGVAGDSAGLGLQPPVGDGSWRG